MLNRRFGWMIPGLLLATFIVVALILTACEEQPVEVTRIVTERAAQQALSQSGLNCTVDLWIEYDFTRDAEHVTGSVNCQ